VSLEKTHQLIEWLETNKPGQQFSLEDLKELLSIAMTELSEQNSRMYDGLPWNVVDELIKEEKATGEFYQLENQIKLFKMRFMS
jgi:hypothetical protein